MLNETFPVIFKPPWSSRKEYLRFFNFQETVGVLEADIYNKVQGYYSKFIEAEMERVRSSHEIFSVLSEKTSKTSRAANYNLFCVSYPSLMEHVT